MILLYENVWIGLFAIITAAFFVTSCGKKKGKRRHHTSETDASEDDTTNTNDSTDTSEEASKRKRRKKRRHRKSTDVGKSDPNVPVPVQQPLPGQQDPFPGQQVGPPQGNQEFGQVNYEQQGPPMVGHSPAGPFQKDAAPGDPIGNEPMIVDAFDPKYQTLFGMSNYEKFAFQRKQPAYQQQQPAQPFGNQIPAMPVQQLPLQQPPPPRVSPKTAQQPAQPKPVQQPAQPKPVQQPAQPKPVQQPAQPKPIQQPVQPKPIQQPAQPKPLQQPGQGPRAQVPLKPAQPARQFPAGNVVRPPNAVQPRPVRPAVAAQRPLGNVVRPTTPGNMVRPTNVGQVRPNVLKPGNVPRQPAVVVHQAR